MEQSEADILPLKAMPWRRWPLGLTASFTADDVVKMKRGFEPRDMDDRWRIQYERNWVRVHRSWTGHCIYAFQLQEEAQGCSVARSWVNRHRRQYRGSSLDEERQRLRSLINRLLLNNEGSP